MKKAIVAAIVIASIISSSVILVVQSYIIPTRKSRNSVKYRNFHRIDTNIDIRQLYHYYSSLSLSLTTASTGDIIRSNDYKVMVAMKHNNRRHVHKVSRSDSFRMSNQDDMDDITNHNNKNKNNNKHIIHPKKEIGIGIDLGTTNSAVAYWNDNDRQPTIITIPHNGRTVPSIVALEYSNHHHNNHHNNHHSNTDSSRSEERRVGKECRP